MKTIFTSCLLTILTVVLYVPLQSQTRSLPVSVTCRKSFFQGSYVLQIQNSSLEDLTLWLQAKGKVTPFVLRAGKMEEFGWVQGYKFDANNLFLIGGSGFDTIKQVMPNVELSPWRIGFSKEGGLALSLSESFLQDRLPKYLKLPIREKPTNYLEMSLEETPRILLHEGSERVYTDAIFKVSLFSGKVRIPIVAGASFIPAYAASTGEVTASEIKVENIDIRFPSTDLSALPREWPEEATRFINKIIPVVFGKYVLHRIEKDWLLRKSVV